MMDWGKLQTLERSMDDIERDLRTRTRAIQPGDIHRNLRTISLSDQEARDWARQIKAFRQMTMAELI